MCLILVQWTKNWSRRERKNPWSLYPSSSFSSPTPTPRAPKLTAAPSLRPSSLGRVGFGLHEASQSSICSSKRKGKLQAPMQHAWAVDDELLTVPDEGRIQTRSLSKGEYGFPLIETSVHDVRGYSTWGPDGASARPDRCPRSRLLCEYSNITSIDRLSDLEAPQLVHHFCNHGFKEHFALLGLPVPNIDLPN